MIERVFETAGSLGGPWAYLVIALLAAAEASIGVGLVVPGETGVIVGGFIVSQGNADFGLMWLVTVTGAIVGDSVGYEIGRHFGPRIRRTRVGMWVGEERWDKAQRYLSRRGGRAIFVGRFVAVVRSLVPAVAGIGRMPYPKFLVWNAFGAVLWASAYLTLGYVGGRSYERIADAAEGAGYVLLALVVLVVGVLAAGRWIAHHPQRFRAWGDAVGAWGPIAFAGRRFGRPLRFLRRRFEPDYPFGLSLTAGLLMLIATAWALVAVASDVEARSDLVNVDLPVARWFAEHRVDWLTDLMHWVSDLGSMVVLIPVLVVAAGAWLVRTRRWGVALFLGVAIVGAVVATDTLKELIERPRPPAGLAAATGSGFAFPSGHVVQATVVFGALAYLQGSVLRWWSARVAVWTAAVLLSLVVGFTRTYLGVHWLSDVIGAYALSAVWLTVVITGFGTGTRFHRHYLSRREGQRTRVSSRAA